MNADDIQKLTLEQENAEDQYFEMVQKQEPIPVESIYKDEIKARLSLGIIHFLDAATHRSKQSVSELKRAAGNG